MRRGGALSAPDLIILWISDSREDREGAPTERIRPFQCQAGEACAPTSDFIGMLSFAFSSVVINIYVSWNSILFWVSIIFGSVLCYSWVISSNNCYAFCMP